MMVIKLNTGCILPFIACVICLLVVRCFLFLLLLTLWTWGGQELLVCGSRNVVFDVESLQCLLLLYVYMTISKPD